MSGFGGGGFSASPNNIQGDATINNGSLAISGSSGALLTITGSGGDNTDTYIALHSDGDVGIRLSADRNNNVENDNPYIDFYQDGLGDVRTQRQAAIGLVGESTSTADGQPYNDALANALFLQAGYSGPVPFQIATNAYSTTPTNERRKARLTIDGFYGYMGINTTSPTQIFDVNDDSIRVRTAKTPASAGDTGSQGQIAWDTNYIYICVATDTWKRVAISTF